MTALPPDADRPQESGQSGPPPSSPPPGSQGYRRQGDPLPRGNPLAGPIKRFNAPPASNPAQDTRPAGPPAPTPPAPSAASRTPVADATQSSRPAQPQDAATTSPDETPSPAAPASPASPIQGEARGSNEPPQPPTPQPATLRRPPADRRGLFMVLAVLISLGVHGSLAWEFYDQPLGHIDPTLIGHERELFRVHRAAEDFILDGPGDRAGLFPDPTQDAAPEDAGAGDPSRDPTPTPLADLSRAMLDVPLSPDQASAAPAASPVPAEPARPFEDQRPAPDAASSADAEEQQGPAPVALPPSIQDWLLVDLPLAVAYVDRNNAGGTPGQAGSAESGQSGVGSAGSGANGGDHPPDARSLLAQANLPSTTPANPPVPALPPPHLADRAPLSEERPDTSSGLPVPVDLSGLTAQAATHLSIPEYLDNDFEYTVTRYLPKDGWGMSKEDLRGYFRVDVTGKRSLRKLQTMPKDLVFLVDISGSISQEWIDHTLRGLRDALASLNEGDRFNIVLFNEQPAILGPESILPFNDENLAKARQFLTEQATGGMTDVNQALSRLLVRDVASDRAYGLVLISDGRPTRGVIDTRELINLITRDNDLAASIYCVGIGRGQNRTLLEFLAYRNKGFCVYVNQPFDAANTIRDLVSRLRYPIMKDIRLSVMGLDMQDIYPRHLPNIHQGETFSIFGRFDPTGQPQPFTMRLMGHNGKQLYDFTFTRDLSQAGDAPQQISRDWGFWKLHDIYNQMLHQGETSQLRREIQTLRRKYKLDTLYND